MVQFLVADPENPGSLFSSLRMARENARTLREILPTEAWEMLNEFHSEFMRELPTGLAKRIAVQLPQRCGRQPAEDLRRARRHHEPQCLAHLPASWAAISSAPT